MAIPANKIVDLAKLDKYAIDYFVSNQLVTRAKNANTRGISFKLTHAQLKALLKRKTCFYCKQKLVIMAGSPKPSNHFTIDRINPKEGYTKENGVACCDACNALKSSFEYKSLKDITRLTYIVEKIL